MSRVGNGWLAAAAIALGLFAPDAIAPTALAAPTPVRAPAETPSPNLPTAKVQLRNVNGLWIPPGLDLHRKRPGAGRGFSTMFPAKHGVNRFIRRSLVKAALAGRGVFGGNIDDAEFRDGEPDRRLTPTAVRGGRAACRLCAARGARCTGIQHYADSLTTMVNHAR